MDINKLIQSQRDSTISFFPKEVLNYKNNSEFDHIKANIFSLGIVALCMMKKNTNF